MDGPRTSRIALLIDAENAEADRIAAVIAVLARRGTVTVRRAYADWTNPCVRPWAAAVRTNAIRPVQLPPVSTRKNAADIALVIDAMDLVHAGGVDALAVVSSDADFTPLALRARDSGLAVLGFGRADAPEALRRACTDFLPVDDLPEAVADQPPESAVVAVPKQRTSPALSDTQLHAVLTRAVTQATRADGWARLAQLGGPLQAVRRQAGFARLSALFRATGRFDVEGDRVRSR